jgi:hypothetical protein
MPNVEVTGAARLHRAASSDRRERGRPPGWAGAYAGARENESAQESALATRRLNEVRRQRHHETNAFGHQGRRGQTCGLGTERLALRASLTRAPQGTFAEARWVRSQRWMARPTNTAMTEAAAIEEPARSAALRHDASGKSDDGDQRPSLNSPSLCRQAQRLSSGALRGFIAQRPLERWVGPRSGEKRDSAPETVTLRSRRTMPPRWQAETVE